MVITLFSATELEEENFQVNKYIDNFNYALYDPDYKHIGGNYSKILTLVYSDGIAIDININDIAEISISKEEEDRMKTNSYTGEGGRVFPEQMNQKTTPRLYLSKLKAIEKMEEIFPELTFDQQIGCLRYYHLLLKANFLLYYHRFVSSTKVFA